MTSRQHRSASKLAVLGAVAVAAALVLAGCSSDDDGDKAAEIDILTGNLRLQRNEFLEAEAIFGDVLEPVVFLDVPLDVVGDLHDDDAGVDAAGLFPELGDDRHVHGAGAG